MIRYYIKPTKHDKLLEVPEHTKGCITYASNATAADLKFLSEELKIDDDLLADSVDILESPRIDHFENRTYIFTRYCYPEEEETATEPLLIIVDPHGLYIVDRIQSPVVKKFFADPKLVTTRISRLTLLLLLTINQSYKDYLLKVSRKLLDLRMQLKRSEVTNEDFITFVEIEEDLNEIASSLGPYKQLLDQLIVGKIVTMYESDLELIEDLQLSTSELIELSKSRLKTISNTREAYSTIMANTLNKTFKKLTSISIFMTIPTVTSGLYGMNVMLPMGNNPNSFWYLLALVTALISLAVFSFKKLKWL